MFTIIFLYMYCWAESREKQSGIGFGVAAVLLGFIELIAILSYLFQPN